MTIIRTALAVTALAALGSGIAVAAEPAPPAGPVGTWAGISSWEGGRTESVLAFRPDGRFCVVDDGDPSDDLSNDGGGTWTMTGDGTFRFSGEERFVDGAGRTIGHLRTEQQAVLAGEQFTSTGGARQFDADGGLVFEVTSTTTMHRTGTGTGDC